MKPQIDRHIATKKWCSIIDNTFSDIKYMIPFIREEISYQLELKNLLFLKSDNRVKLPIFLDNIKTYILETIPYYYIKDIKVAVNPFNGEVVFEYNGTFLNIKSLQKEKINQYLIDIDFINAIDKLYDKNPNILLRKLKLKKIK